VKVFQYQLNQIFKLFPYPVPKYLVIGIIFAIFVRLICVPNKSVDYKFFLSPWYDFIVSHGGFSALKYSFADYTPAYIYWILIATTLLSGIPKILAIKLFAMSTDFLCAFLVYKIVKLKYLDSRIPIFAFLAVLLSPNCIYHSSLWGQCDVIYTTGLVSCVYFLSVRKQIPALISFGIAISFKLQAMFLAPLLLVMFSKKRVNWYFLPLIPLVYLIAILPTWVAGRPILDLLLVYFNQANKYKELAKGVPNLYQWIPNSYYHIVVPIGLIITVLAMFLLVYIIHKSKLEITQDRLIYLATISVLFMPYILPKMHDRYFYPADIFTIIFAFYFPEYRWVAIVMQMASFFSYLGTHIYIKLFSIPLAFTLWFVVRNFDMVSLSFAKPKYNSLGNED